MKPKQRKENKRTIASERNKAEKVFHFFPKGKGG